MDEFKVNILGCGAAKPSLRHFTSCQVLQVRNRLLVVDCGEAAQLGVMRQRLSPHRITDIFISHTHGDHCLGLVGLVSTMGLDTRTAPLTIHVGADGLDILRRMLDHFCTVRPFEVRYNVLPPPGQAGVPVYEDKALTVTTLPLEHRVPTVGFLFREKPKLRHILPDRTAAWGVPNHYMNSLREGRDYVTPDGRTVPNAELTSAADPSFSYAYCSDTRPCAALTEALTGVDWIYHEATYGESERQAAHNRYHSTARQAAETARDAGAKRLVLGHFSHRYDLCEEQLLAEARQVFPATILAREGLTLDITDTRWHDNCSDNQ